MKNVGYKLLAIIVFILGTVVFGILRKVLSVEQGYTILVSSAVPITVAIATIWATRALWRTSKTN